MDGSNNRRFTGPVCSALGVLVVVALLTGCATQPTVPTEAMAEARQAIASAEQAGARQHAGAELDEAREKLALAENAVGDENMVDAERLARESAVVAELAAARTESARAEAINREMGLSAEALREEMQRQGEKR